MNPRSVDASASITKPNLFTYRGADFPAAGTPTANFIGMETSFAAVPEPASWVLLATGLFALGMVVRRGRS